MKKAIAGMALLASAFTDALANADGFKKPEWFENARFGVFCHWGIQCTPEAGDWYGHNMYKEGHWQNKYHKEHYGDPKEFGLKDFAPLWKAENWKPEELVSLYKRMGARYILAMANHHDNFDNWDSKYQPWNSVNMGPKKDIVGGWAKAARDAGMRFGVSIHASHAWTWYEYGREKGDTLLTKADGKGKWWEGYDPQQLYCQQHAPSAGYEVDDNYNVWVWGDKAAKPSAEYIENFRLRTMDLIEKYKPDLLYFDDVVLPFHGISDVGWRIVDDYHKLNASWHGGKSEGIVNGKRLWPEVCDKLTRNIERGTPGAPMYPHWQTDTCIGDWHYDRSWFSDKRYRGARGILRTLVDTVSKNGNLVISIPIRADGTIDEEERAICEDIAAWMEVNGKAIFDTVPYEVCGEGPQIEKASELGDDVEFNEGRIPQPGKEDVRYLKSKDGKTLYAVALVPPDEGEKPKFPALKGKVSSVQRLGQVKDFPAVWKFALKDDFHDWADTPPMGWNSWDCYGSYVNEEQVKANADFQSEHLLKHGYDYCVVDIRWTIQNEDFHGYNQKDPVYTLDRWGRYLPAPNRFPSSAGGKGFKPLADYVHAKGLKFGIHIMRGVPKEAVAKKLPVLGANGVTCDQIGNNKVECFWLKDNCTVEKDKPGAQEYYDSIFALYAEWGVDFVKVDDLSSPFYHRDEVEMIRKAIDKCGRPMVFSTSPGETPLDASEHLQSHANMWRMVNDVWDSWKHIEHLVPIACDWLKSPAKKGCWPDCDMIPLGKLGVTGHWWSKEGEKGRKCNLTTDEQRTLMNFFAICRSPLIIGADLPQLKDDPATLALLTDPLILAAQRDGRNPKPLFCDADKCAIVSDDVKGDKFLALFNLKNEAAEVSALDVTRTLPPHGSVLIRLTSRPL